MRAIGCFCAQDSRPLLSSVSESWRGDTAPDGWVVVVVVVVAAVVAAAAAGGAATPLPVERLFPVACMV